MRQRRNFTPEFKAQLVAEVKTGKTAHYVGHKHNVDPTVLRRWVAASGNPDAPKPRRYLSPEFKAQVVRAVRHGMSVPQAMAKWSLGNSVVYAWLKADRSPRPRTAPNARPTPSLEAAGPSSAVVLLATAVLRNTHQAWAEELDPLAQSIVAEAIRAGWRLEKP